MSHWTDEYATMIGDCEAREDRLSEWERGFIDSIGYQLKERGSLTQKQVETLESVWEKATKKG